MAAKRKSKTTAETVPEAKTGESIGGDLKGITTANPTAGTAMADRLRIEMWPVDRLVRHPDNRLVNTQTQKYRDLAGSVAANGVLEPLIVRERVDEKTPFREALGVRFLQVLSGERRFHAAVECGLTEAPVRNLGKVPDDLAYDVVAMTNLHEDLTPIEEGHVAATWLDQYKQDIKAVASKLGKTEHWVLTHAQIERNLIPAWKAEAMREASDKYDHRREYLHWTAAHWVHIARLPKSLQEYWLNKIQKDYRFDPHDASADDVARWLVTEKLFLAAAPFDAGKVCADCPKRTDAISQLLWQDPDAEADAADAVRCLDPKCWERKGLKQEKQAYELVKQAADHAYAEKHGAAGLPVKPVPISTIEVKTDWSDWQKYEEAIKPAKRVFGRKLVTADRFEIVKEGAKGAVPGIVVAGKGKGKLMWVKIKAKKEDGSPRSGPTKPHEPTAAEIEQGKEIQRWERAAVVFQERMLNEPAPRADVILLLQLFFDHDNPWGREREKLLSAAGKAIKKDPDQPILCVAEWFWKDMMHKYYFAENTRETLEIVGPVLGFDAQAEYELVKLAMAAEEAKPKDAKDAKDVKDEKSETCPNDCPACTLTTSTKTGCPVGQPEKGQTPGKKKRGRPKKSKAEQILDGVQKDLDAMGDADEAGTAGPVHEEVFQEDEDPGV